MRGTRHRETRGIMGNGERVTMSLTARTGVRGTEDSVLPQSWYKLVSRAPNLRELISL